MAKGCGLRGCGIIVLVIIVLFAALRYAPSLFFPAVSGPTEDRSKIVRGTMYPAYKLDDPISTVAGTVVFHLDPREDPMLDVRKLHVMVMDKIPAEGEGMYVYLYNKELRKVASADACAEPGRKTPLAVTFISSDEVQGTNGGFSIELLSKEDCHLSDFERFRVRQ